MKNDLPRKYYIELGCETFYQRKNSSICDKEVVSKLQAPGKYNTVNVNTFIL